MYIFSTKEKIIFLVYRFYFKLETKFVKIKKSGLKMMFTSKVIKKDPKKFLLR